ncbi:hypothetical protein HDEF_0816 [Candidatus Hamiltonella defensa 5AT (Acyrthosiphon pisum)]|uniref:Uncharacterized protein n=1 Tax=Hamiltonella defensa subsp. Acyrthosiphon pisum (strain 5AT) TaxID=572265 RepID=C4K4P5_HAMD5|nr:hypothetical protein HDEF_0816 [Candidatus Hamiltonella defensa 5AT (Acyrthosiphon pisum)]
MQNERQLILKKNQYSSQGFLQYQTIRYSSFFQKFIFHHFYFLRP